MHQRGQVRAEQGQAAHSVAMQAGHLHHVLASYRNMSRVSPHPATPSRIKCSRYCINEASLFKLIFMPYTRQKEVAAIILQCIACCRIGAGGSCTSTRGVKMSQWSRVGIWKTYCAISMASVYTSTTCVQPVDFVKDLLCLSAASYQA